MKRIMKRIGIGVLGVVIIIVSVLAYYTIQEYRPDQIENIEVKSEGKLLNVNQTIKILSLNTGYAGLDKSQDFFMDGGNMVRPDSQEIINQNLIGITNILKTYQSDVYFLQEVDLNSKRSYNINQIEYYENQLGLTGLFARNFKVSYVPYPWPPIGKVESGIMTMSQLQISSASRISLPESFSWPIKTANLKRCMLETRIPIEDSDKELVLINFHLEAYDSGEGKIAQTRMLAEKLKAEYDKGNYVIAGGDFNQTFEGSKEYPIVDKEGWVPGIISKNDLPEHFDFAIGDQYPTCRLLNHPYTSDYETSQVYIIDGFIVSDNIEIKDVENINDDFKYTDHQPVQLE
ncbi:endonuclease/exonuclease/phosphatase family protein, partial [Candidatus Stoquefichus massiliensis]|uniref:endonuclease/exonuclease/phosphatase family protein n=1 Tax=Candidatus Stoquefichus massiliensis TaxID=1470350 RepID=UPI00048622DA